MEHYLGYLTAESSEEKENFLPRTFTMTESIKKALGPNVCFVCGRKGAGKTAIAEMTKFLTTEVGDKLFSCSIGITEEDYQEFHNVFFQELEQIAIGKKEESIARNLEQCYYYLWRYILDLMTFQAALNVPNLSVDYTTEIEVIQSYMADKIVRSASDHAMILAADILMTSQQTATPLTYFTIACKNLRYTTSHINAERAAQAIFRIYTAAVTIDTMEQYDLTNYRIYPLRGLCHAVKEYQTERKYNKVALKCFLPAELTDRLFRDNLAKYNEFASYIRWSYSDLIEFMARRYYLFLSTNQDKPSIDLVNKIKPLIEHAGKAGNSHHDYWFTNFWLQICPEKIKNKFGWPENSCAYLIRHTQKRPREIMSCMNFVIDYSITRGEFPKISEQTLHDGIHDDNNIYQLLSDNLSIFNLPRREESVAQIASELIADESTIFSGAHFSRFAKRALAILSTEDNIDRADFAKTILLRSGLVGRIRPYSPDEPAHIWVEPEGGAQCKYYITEFEYLMPGYVSINENSLCAVHPILSDRLSLRPPLGDRGIVYPLPESADLITQLNEKRS